MERICLLLLEELPGRSAKGRKPHRGYLSSSCTQEGEILIKGRETARRGRAV